jgi:hypothetical protein
MLALPISTFGSSPLPFPREEDSSIGEWEDEDEDEDDGSWLEGRFQA